MQHQDEHSKKLGSKQTMHVLIATRYMLCICAARMTLVQNVRRLRFVMERAFSLGG
jgi:hypothetical protein